MTVVTSRDLVDAYLGIYMLNYKPEVDLDLFYVLSFWSGGLDRYTKAILLICAMRPTVNINGSYRDAITLVNTTPFTPLSRRLLRKSLELCFNGYIIIFTRAFGRVITA